ncbi:hypothetical protein [Lactococcus garvieae]|uniref:hypothetical protein n=1 Tax=Lactococcus garvieae TaxID=1363 RepID=UPI0002E8B9B5|nr:hypothetical protein [Lactococcus garvieae]MCI3861006.1 hypothetical protein [Lactococcus garvieae]
MNKSKILLKIKSLGTPKEVATMFQNTNNFISCHQFNYPKPSLWNRGEVYISLGSISYIFMNKKLKKVTEIPERANVITLTNEKVTSLALFLGVDDKNPSVILKKLLTIENMKKYQEILLMIDQGFKTNMNFAEFTLLIRK